MIGSIKSSTRKCDVGKVIKNLFGDNGAADAKKAQARAEASRVAAEEASKNMQANFATDLKQENTGTVLAGGSADAVASQTSDLLKKKKSAGLSSQLGLNV